MKKFLTTVILAGLSLPGVAQTATNFTCNDCSGVSHTLFNELDAGKVIVLCWVMPCASCTGPSLTTYNVVQSFQASHPGKVIMYVVDDYANTSCVSINSWSNSVGLINTTRFSNATIKMSNYGIDGMPKIVVLGGAGHTVFLNVNNSIKVADLQNAINSAISVTGIGEQQQDEAGLLVTPNPSNDQAEIEFSLSEPAEVSVDLLDLRGKVVKTLYIGRLSPGSHTVEARIEALPAARYVVRLFDGTNYRHTSLVKTD